MSEDDIRSWLEAWCDERLTASGYAEAKASMTTEAQACKAAALSHGISAEALIAAGGGDLAAYLADRQDAATDDEIDRMMEKDE